MKQRIGMTLLCILCAAALVWADQAVKQWVYDGIRINGSMLVIPKFLSFTYVENYGAAFNILMNQRWFLVIFGIVLSVAMVYVLYRSFGEEKSLVLIMERVSIVMILAGAMGNILDRVIHVFVIDFLQVLFIDFPVFNVADCYIVVGCILLFVLLLFFDKERLKDNE